MTFLLQANCCIYNESFRPANAQIGVQECDLESVHFWDLYWMDCVSLCKAGFG